MATITFNQTGLSPAGITNRSRSDGLINGAKVSIVLDETGTVTFVDVPEGDVNSVASLASESPLVWSFTPTPGIYGSWLVEFQPSAPNTKPVRRVFAVRTPEKGLRIPAFNEHASSLATVATGPSFIDQSDDNEGGTYRGWTRSLAELFRTVANGLFTANKVQESGGPATLNVSTIPASGVLRRNSSSQIVGGPVLIDNAGNITGAGTYNTVAVAAHAARHGDGGADEISVTGLSGLLADAQTAGSLKTATTTVALSAAAAPTAGQILTASSSTEAAWTTPSSSGVSNTVPVQLSMNTVGAAGVSMSVARDDHAHAILANGTPTALTPGNAAVIGISGHAARSDHVHPVPGLATTSVNGFMPATSASKLAGIAAGADVTLTALSTAAVDITVNNKKITGLANPTQSQDACTKGYADAVTQGLDVKSSCRVIATGNITLSGTQTIDGVVVQVGNRVLCAGQTTGSQNGIYVVAAGAWTRPTDADTSADVSSGMFTFVIEGTGNADSGWVLTTPDPIVLDTTPLVFTQFSGAGQVESGAGLTKIGNTLNVVANADGSLVVSTDDVRVGVISDTQHGSRGGDTQHSAVTPSVNGFMLAADKAKLDGIAAGADVTLTALATTSGDIAVNSKKITGLADPTNAQDACTKAYADAGGAVAVTAGTGLTKTGTTLNVVANADGSIVINADDIQLGVVPFSKVQTALGAATADIAVNSKKLTLLAAPTAAQDAATKAYVDANASLITAGTGLTKTGTTLNVVANADGSIIVNADDVQLGVVPFSKVQAALAAASADIAVNSKKLTLLADPTVAQDAATKAYVDANASLITAGTGLTKTGSTLNVVANADGSIIANADDVRVGVLATDAQHGTRGGGTLHATAVAGGAAGFISGTDQTKLNNAVAGPVSSINGNFASFNGTNGKLLQDSGVNANTLVTGPASAVTNNFVSFTDTSGKTVKDSGVSATSLANAVSGPASAGDGNVASFNFTSGKLIQDSGFKASDVARGSASAVTNNLVSFNDTSGKTLKDSGVSASSLAGLAGLAPGQSASVGRLTVDTILETPTNVVWTSSITLDAAVKNDYTINALTGTTNITWSNPAAGRQGTLAVRMDGVGSRQTTINAPGGWTLMRDSASSDLAPSPAANAITIYTWSFITVGGANILLVGKIIAV